MITVGLVKSRTVSLVLLPIWLICAFAICLITGVQSHSDPLFHLFASAVSSRTPKFLDVLFTDMGTNA